MATRFRLNFEQIFGTSAQVLAGGTLTFCISHGAPDQLQAIYSDDALTVTKLNPVTLDSAGKHGDIFLSDDDYRVIVKDAAGIVQPGGDIDPVHGGPNVTGGVVNVTAFGAKGDGVANDSAAIQAAIDTCSAVFFPPGTYLCNVSVNCRVRISGAGSSLSILKPYNTAIAAVTLTNQAGDWAMSYLFEALGFSGNNNGIGVTFAKSDPTQYAAGDELVSTTSFNNCRFYGLGIGIQRPFGNLGLYLNRTSFMSCTYGTYNLSAKFGGAIMHAGCFYCFGGSSMANTCGHYFHNTQDGYGAVEFDGHVFEQNAIGFYGYHSGSVMVTPFAFRSYWNEANGAASAGHPATVVIDSWAGTVKSTVAMETHAFIFAGGGISASFRDGFFTDVWLNATDSIVNSQSDRLESESGYGGFPCKVFAPNSSRIIIKDPTYQSGGVQVPGVMVDGIVTQGLVDLGNQGATGRANIIPARLMLADLNNIVGANNACNVVAAGAADFQPGSKTVAASAAVGDGSFYADAAAYSDTLTSAQFCRLAGSLVTISPGFWAWTVDIKMLTGAAGFFCWDLASATLGSVSPVADGQWHCYGGFGRLLTGTPSLGLVLSGASPAGAVFSFRLRNFQIKGLGSRTEAQDFLRAGIYAI